MSSPAQIRAIQSLRRKIVGFGDEHYRACLSTFGVDSSKSLTVRDAGQFIEELKRLAGQGAARSRDDKALIAFVKRMTGKEHTRFLTPVDANLCVEALKQWAEREGVEWSAHPDPKACFCRAITRKLVAEGGFTPFVAGADPWPSDVEQYAYRRAGMACPASFRDYTGAHWDALMAALGKRLRGVRAAKRRGEG